jgi:hypothetical protein
MFDTPEIVVEILSTLVTGGIAYWRNRKKNDESILRLRAQGLTTQQLANSFQLDYTRIQKILVEQAGEVHGFYEKQDIDWTVRYEIHCRENNVHYEPAIIGLSQACTCT